MRAAEVIIAAHVRRPVRSAPTMIRSGTLPILAAIAAFVVGGVVLCSAAVVAIRTTAVSTAAPVDPGEFGKRVLVIVAHPDDETLAAGGTIHHLIATGARVKVVLVTAGDSYRRAAARLAGGAADAESYVELGNVRHVESLAAAVQLGLASADVVSLGYSDLAVPAMWDSSWDSSTPARGRTAATTVPYAWAARPGASVCGQGLATDLASAITAFAPETIIAPDPYETHADHALVAAFATYAMDSIGYGGRRLSAVVHFRHYPYPWAHLPGSALNPPPNLIASDTTWMAVPLDQADKRAKEAAIAEYRSQTAIADLGLYMRAFVRTNELFASRVPARAQHQDADVRPPREAAVPVWTTPKPVVPPAPGSTRPRIAWASVTSGPGTMWIGLHCDGPVAPRDTFRLGLRLFGEGEAPARLDVSVEGTTVSIPAVAENSISPAGVRAEIDGDTMWLAVPASVWEGRNRLMIGAAAGRGEWSPRPTAWREVEL
jgi:LmbE family N-acetylglucosaminyl deacetylase